MAGGTGSGQVDRAGRAGRAAGMPRRGGTALARARPLAVCAVLVAAGLLGGCASGPKHEAPDLQVRKLAALLPGHYDNAAQVAADLAAGRAPHPAVKLVIAPIDSLTVGERAFYFEASDAADPQRILRQRVFSLQAARGGVLQMMWSLADPGRWRNAAQQPELLSALQAPDIKSLAGCQLVWQEEAGGFKAENEPGHCHATPPELPTAVSVRWKLELSADALGWGERTYDADGRELGGRGDEPLLRLRKVVN